MRRVSSFIALATAALIYNAAQAHDGGQPEHGGIVRLLGDVSLELVAAAQSVDLYVEDDGQEIASADYAARLTILSNGTSSEVDMRPVAGNKFEAPGVQVPKGATVAVLLILKDKVSKLRANFVIS